MSSATRLVELVAFVACACACACGSAAPPTPATPSPASAPAKAAPAAPSAGSGSGITAEQSCARFAELAKSGCTKFNELAPPDGLCTNMMKSILLDPQGHALAVCAVSQPDCDAVMNCLREVALHAPRGSAS